MKRLIILIVLISSLNIFSQVYSEALRIAQPGLGAHARALGMGNAYIALSDDASASFFNPAGYGLVKRIELSGGIDYSNFGNKATFFGNTTDYSNSSGRLSRLSFVLPIPTTRGSLSFGLAYQNNKDLTSTIKFDAFNPGNTSYIQDYVNNNNGFPDEDYLYNHLTYQLFLSDVDSNDNHFTPFNGRLTQSGTIINKGGLESWVLGGAIEIARNLYVGANFDIITGSFESNNEYLEEDLNNIYQGETIEGIPSTTDFRSFYLNRLLKWDISGFSGKFGLLYQLPQLARIGFTVQLPKYYKIKESYSVGTTATFANSTEDYPEFLSDNVEYAIYTPLELSGGFSINFKGLIVNADASFIDYTQMEYADPVGLSESYLNSENKRIKDDLAAVLNYNVGLEYTIPGTGLRVRGGYFSQPSPYKDDDSKFDKNFLTAGLGILTEEMIGIDIAYVHGRWEDFGDNYGSGVSRTFQKVTYNKVLLSASFRF